MTKLKLPLHCYDEAGRIIPSVWFTLVLLWGARAIWVLASAMLLGDNGETIRLWVFPVAFSFKLHLGLGGIYLMLWFVLGRREWFWKKNDSLQWTKVLLYVLLALDIGLQCFFLSHSVDHFDAVSGSMLLITTFTAMYVGRSKRTRFMYEDWRA